MRAIATMLLPFPLESRVIPPFNNRRFFKLCWVVPDVHAAVKAWVSSSGAGPFFLFDKVTFENPMYRGRPTELPDLTAAIGQAGDCQVELLAQRDDRPSFIRDVVPAGQMGFHHVALYCTDYDADFAAYTSEGAEVAFNSTMMGTRNCWIDTKPSLGFMIELLEANPIADVVFAKIRAAAENWDGTDPIRTFS